MASIDLTYRVGSVDIHLSSHWLISSSNRMVNCPKLLALKENKAGRCQGFISEVLLHSGIVTLVVDDYNDCTMGVDIAGFDAFDTRRVVSVQTSING